MNYIMQGMTKTIPKLFTMLKSAKVEIKKNIKCWWLTRPLVSRKGAKGRRGTSRRMANKVVARVKKPKSGPKPETKCFYYKGTGHWKRNYPLYLADKKDGKVNKLYLIYMLLMCTSLVFIATPQYLMLVQLLRVVTRNGSCKINRD